MNKLISRFLRKEKKVRKRFIALIVLISLSLMSLIGCEGAGIFAKSDIPLPDNFYIPQAEETEAGSSDENLKAADEDIPPENTSDDEELVKSTIHYFLDTSNSMRRSPEVIKVHSAASKCAAGYNDRHYYGLEKGKLIEVTEQLALSGEYGSGAPIDLIVHEELPYDPSGVNIITTDLQSSTSSSQLGQWLVDTGCTGYSFYIFTMQYNGSLEFETYTSNSTRELVSVDGCSFKEKEFLMIVFGDNTLVEDYDQFFQSKLETSMKYDTCHVSLHDDTENLGNFLKLTSSKCFSQDIANVEYDNTNYVYGLSLVDTEDVEFTCSNTFVYKKSGKSAGKDPKAVKAILYAVPDAGTELPDVKEASVTKIQEYDKKEGIYKDSKVTFELSAASLLNGFPSVADDPESEKDETLREKLGGNIVAEGSVFTVTVENKDLPKGLYSVEAQIVFEASGETADLQKFSEKHNAGLEDYTAAIQSQCTPEEDDGQLSTNKFIYTGDGENSAFSKLLEFERLTDELIAAGAVTEADNEMITLRLVIDNR